MMIHSLCNSCLQPYQILVEPSELGLIKEISDADGLTCKCPRLCGGVINLVSNHTISKMSIDPRLKDPLQLTGKELYKAIGGLGLPDEIPKNAETVAALLTASGLKGFDLHETGGKLYLSELELFGGTKLHLSSGPHGAQVLKVTKERR